MIAILHVYYVVHAAITRKNNWGQETEPALTRMILSLSLLGLLCLIFFPLFSPFPFPKNMIVQEQIALARNDGGWMFISLCLLYSMFLIYV